MNYVYVACRPDGAHKIGLSCEPAKRMSTLDYRLSYRGMSGVRLIWSLERPNNDGSRVECSAQNLLKERSLDGEWFSVDADKAINAVVCAASFIDAGGHDPVSFRSFLTKRGMEEARSNGRRLGRPPKATDAQVRQMAAAVRKGESLRSIGARFGLSPTGVQKAIERVERKGK